MHGRLQNLGVHFFQHQIQTGVGESAEFIDNQQVTESR
jgi:hypothetical protein